MIDKFTIFREMLDYLAHISTVTDADMNYCGDRLIIGGETDSQSIIIEVIIKNKEDKKDA